MLRDEARAYAQHRVVINGNVEVQLNGVTETHLIALWPGSHEQLALSLEDVDTLEFASHICTACGTDVEVVHGEEAECTECTRQRLFATPFQGQPCDDCGRTGVNVWRDPITRKNEYFCSTCHVKRGKVFLNRWAPSTWQGAAYTELECLGRNVRGAKDCRGSVLLRGPKKIPLCNAHAGKYHREGG